MSARANLSYAAAKHRSIARGGEAAHLASMATLLDPEARGRVILVGAGPGDPGLLTVRAVEALKRADVVVHDGLIDARVLDLAPENASRISVAKRRSRHTLPQEAINALIVAHVRAGSVVVHAVGESPASAFAIGYSVAAIRYAAVMFGGAMAGAAGAYVSVIYTSLWTEGLTAGRGWIAIALVVFATWQPERVMLGAYLFGGVSVMQMFVQAQGVALPSELMTALPYVATILVLILISRDSSRIRLAVPASLGKSFLAGS